MPLSHRPRTRRAGVAVLAAGLLAGAASGTAAPPTGSAERAYHPPRLPSWVLTGARPLAPRPVFPDALAGPGAASGIGPPVPWPYAGGGAALRPVDGSGAGGLPPAVRLSAAARADLDSGVVDRRVVAVLAALAARHTVVVGVLRSGHSKYVAGTSAVSNHYYGRAVDIVAIDGEPVAQGSAAARTVVAELLAAPRGLRPEELGQPWPDVFGDGVFSNAAHQDHLHLGYYAADGSRGP